MLVFAAPYPSGVSDIPADLGVETSNLTYVNNANSIAMPLPSGAAAGMWCIVFAAHGFSVSTPAGWNSLYNNSGVGGSGACFEKELTSGDISAGSVTVSFGGTYHGVLAAVCLTAKSLVRSSSFARNATGSLTRSRSSDSSPQAGDFALFFGEGRGTNGGNPATITCDKGATLQSNTDTEAASILTGIDSLGAGGTVTATWTYQTIGAQSDFQALLIITVPRFTVDPTVASNTGFWGEGDTATVSYTAASGTATIEWQRDGVAIGGATSASYTFVSGDVGHSVRPKVTLTAGSLTSAAFGAAHTIVTPAFATEDRVTSAGDQRVTSTGDVRIVSTRIA